MQPDDVAVAAVGGGADAGRHQPRHLGPRLLRRAAPSRSSSMAEAWFWLRGSYLRRIPSSGQCAPRPKCCAYCCCCRCLPPQLGGWGLINNLSTQPSAPTPTPPAGAAPQRLPAGRRQDCWPRPRPAGGPVQRCRRRRQQQRQPARLGGSSRLVAISQHIHLLGGRPRLSRSQRLPAQRGQRRLRRPRAGATEKWVLRGRSGSDWGGDAFFGTPRGRGRRSRQK